LPRWMSRVQFPFPA